jgi:hypothetical protein
MLAKLNKIKNWQAAIVIAIVGFAIFSTGIFSPFMGDDIGQIVNSVPVHSITHFHLFFEGGTYYNGGGLTPLSGSYYRPLVPLSYSLLYTFFGPHALYFHLFQLLIGIGSVILLFLFLRYSFKPLLALALALLFLVHPINSQDIFAIASVGDCLFFFFGILSLWLLLHFRSMKSLILVALGLFLSLLSKEAGGLFLIMVLLYLIWWDRKRLLPFVGVMILPAAIYLALRAHAVGTIGQTHIAPIDNLNLADRLMTAPSIMQFYLTKFLFPTKLASGYYWVYRTFSFRHVLFPLLIDLSAVGLSVFLAFAIRKRVSKAQYYTYMFFAIWAFLGIFPYLQIIPLDMTACEIWFYFSAVGFIGMLGSLLVAFRSYVRLDWFFIVVALVIGALGVRTAFRGLDYRSSYTLAQHDIVSSQGDYYADEIIAQNLDAQGRFQEAKTYALRSTSIYPTITSYQTLGQTLGQLNDYPAAVGAFDRGIRYGVYSPLYEDLGLLTLVYGNPTTNQRFLESSLRTFPQDSTLWMYLAFLEEKEGNNTGAKVAIANAAKFGRISSIAYDDIMNNRSFTLSVPQLRKSIEI